MGYTLVSIGRLDQLGYSVTFADGTCTIRSPDDDVPKSQAGLYRVIHTGGDDSANAVETVTVMELHRRMGHISPTVARRFCEACVYAKATRKPVAKERAGERAKEFAAEVHTDVWGPAPVQTLHLLRQKSEAFTAYQQFEAWCRTQHGVAVKALHSDRGREYHS